MQRVELKDAESAALRRAMDVFTAKINLLQEIYGLPPNSQPTPDCKAFVVPDNPVSTVPTKESS